MRVVFGAERGRFGIYAKGCLGRVVLSTSLLETRVISHDTHLSIGSLMFDGMGQIDLRHLTQHRSAMFFTFPAVLGRKR